MKPHLRFRLRAGVRHRPVGVWHDVRLANVDASGFGPDIDAVFARHRTPVWITHEYEPADGRGWSDHERACAMDRTFRAVGQTDRRFRRELAAELAALPMMESVGLARIGTSPIGALAMAASRPAAWAGEMVGLGEAHGVTTGDPDVVVAVLDTGVDLTHPEIVDRLRPGRDLVDIIDGADAFVGDAVGADDVADDPGVGHGTHVSGIIGAGGRAMPPGVVPGCRLLPVRVLGALQREGRLIGAGLVDNIDNGIKWAVDNGASIVNMSLGIQHTRGGLPHAQVVEYARLHDVVIAAAAGNDGTDQLYYPGSLPGVLAVAAVDRDRRAASFSTWGRQVDLAAPGVEIYSSLLRGTYGFASGTSQASPFVAGAAALLRAAARKRGHRLTAAQVRHLLVHTADRPGREFKDLHVGHGVINLPDALRLLEYRLDSRETPAADHRRARRPATARAA